MSLALIVLLSALTVLKSDRNTLLVEFELGELDTETINLSDYEGFLFIRGGNSVAFHEPGMPMLPAQVVSFALPPDAKPLVRVSVKESYQIRLKHPVLPVPLYADDGMSPIYKEGELYTESGLFPSDVSDSLHVAWARGLRIGSIRIFPFQYDPKHGILKVNKRILVRVDYGDYSLKSTCFIGDDPFKLVYKQNLLNYDVAKYWYVDRHPAKQDDPFEQAQVWLRIAVVSDGIYEITYSDLHALGLDGIRTDAVKLFSFGPDSLPSALDAADTVFVEVPIKIEDGGDGVLDPGDRILFYGSAPKGYYWDGEGFVFRDNPYSDTVFYWFGINTQTPPRTVESRGYQSYNHTLNAHTRFFRHELNLLNLAQKGLWWLGEEIWRYQREPTAELNVSFDLPGLNGTHGEMRIVVVAARKNQERWILLRLNGELVDSFSIRTGGQPVAVSRVVELDNLRASGNELKLTVVAPTTYIENDDYVILDYFDIKYSSVNSLDVAQSGLVFFDSTYGLAKVEFDRLPSFVWDVSDPMNPVELEIGGSGFVDSIVSGARYCVSSEAKSPVYVKLANIYGLRSRVPDDVDYLMLVPSQFVSAARKLAEWRAQHLPILIDSVWTTGEGNVWIAKLEDIFQEFGFGARDPSAIRNFVKFVYEHTNGNLKYLLLVGDATYDYKGYSNSDANFLPPYEPWMLLWVETPGYSAFDDFYADVVGGEGMPDVFIGRIPVRTDAELLNFVNKVIAYDKRLAMGMWRDRVMLVADDEFGPDQQRPTDGWIHMGSIDRLYQNRVPNFMETDHVYMIEFPRPQPYVRLGASEAFIRTFNRGALLGFIFIHGNPVQLAHEELFKLEKHADLINAGLKNPFVFIASCKVGAFERIKYPRCVAEDWAIRPGGAIATLSSTGLTLPTENERYAIDVFRLIDDSQPHPLGELDMVGKLWGYRGYARYYVLLGDPGVAISLPTPNIQVNMADSIRKGRRVSWTATIEDGVGGGEIYARAYGVKKMIEYVMPVYNRTYYYMRPPDPFFVGRTLPADSMGGSFFVPVSIDTGSPSNFIVFYPQGGEHGLVGSASRLTILPQEGLPGDNEPPHAEFIYNGRKLEDGDRVSSKVLLELRLTDESGINLAKNVGGAEPGISLWLDASPSFLDLTDYFEYDFNSDTSGSAVFQYEFPSEGEHVIHIRVYDSFENLGTYDWQLEVIGEEERLRIIDPLVYPNPVDREGPVRFAFGLTADAYVRVSVYTISGRLIWQSPKLFRHKDEYEPIFWNGLDSDGDELSNGLYFFVIEAEDLQGKTTKVVEKFAVAK